MVARGWAQVHDSVADAARHLSIAEDRMPMNKVGLITKVKADGSTKHRLVWDLRRSGVNSAAWQGQRIILPR
eukprot:5443082-Amphidinium_carterae.1